MKKILFLLVICFLFFKHFTFAQSFTQTAGGAILDNTTAYFPLTISGLPNAIDASYGLLSCQINVNHSYTGDIKIWLKAPNGDSVGLAYNRGGGGDNFVNTIFKMDAVTIIGNGTNPYTGEYVPETSLNNVNVVQNPNGIWMLGIRDEVPADEGNLINYTIVFGDNPPTDPPPPPGPCSMTNGQNCLCPDGTADCDLLPDMTSSELIIQNQHTEYPGYMTLSNATPNIGFGPMEIHGIDSCFCNGVSVPCSQSQCPDGSYVKQLVKQTVYHRSGSTITTSTRSAGFMSYHPSHGHIHVDNWADFSLRQSNGNPDATTWPIIGTGTKMSFCLINLGDCTSNLGYCKDNNGNTITMADIPNSPFGMVSGCGLNQGIFTGNLDIYSQGMSGMSIDFGNICNGDYYVVSITDPNNNFLEQDETNNWVAVPITLTDQLPATTGNFTSNVLGTNGIFSGTISDGATFSWDFGDGSEADTTNLLTMHQFPGNGIYEVNFTVTSSCTTFVVTQTVEVLTTKTVEQATTANFSTAPNPFSNTTLISYSLLKNSNVSLEIYNSVGQKITSLAYGVYGVGNYRFEFNPKDLNLNSGIYFLRFNSDDKTETLKLIYTNKQE